VLLLLLLLVSLILLLLLLLLLSPLLRWRPSTRPMQTHRECCCFRGTCRPWFVRRGARAAAMRPCRLPRWDRPCACAKGRAAAGAGRPPLRRWPQRLAPAAPLLLLMPLPLLLPS
jgi:hypothetical protein